MGETLNILFAKREDGTYEVQVKESWSGRTVSGGFIPPYSGQKISALQKKLNNLGSSDRELCEIGYRLFSALCGAHPPGTNGREPVPVEQPVQTVLRGVIQRTLKKRGTVALMLGFGPGCDEFVRYPWELLHNGDHFLLASGVFTLSRVLLRPDSPVGCELPVHPPFRVLYIGVSPSNCTPLETERSFEAMQQALAPLIDTGQIFLDRLEPPTFSQLVRYLNSYGGAGMLDDNETVMPCYVVHFDGHGAYGRLCPQEDCETINEPEARKCRECGSALGRSKAQTYLCFCDDNGLNHFIDTQSLRDLFLSSDLRLAVFSACETATVTGELTRQQAQSGRAAVDATLAIALVTAQVPAVVAMPFSLQDDLSPTFMYHFYEALADGRTLEEALSRARQALLPTQQKSWFIPVLYRHVAEGEESPVALMVVGDDTRGSAHPLAYLGASGTFVGRERELAELDQWLATITTGEQKLEKTGPLRTRNGSLHHIAVTGSAGIGKSALAMEVVRRNRHKFPGSIIGVSLQDGKSFADALLEMIHHLHLPPHGIAATDVKQRARTVQSALRSLANRELPSLLLLDSFEEVKDRAELETWLQFLCSLAQEVVVIVTSRANPENMMAGGGSHCRWYEYRLGKMTDADLLDLFKELAAESGLDQRIHLDDAKQQRILREICALLDGYPLGAELIFGTARSIDGKVYTPEAATRSLEEVRDELRSTPLEGILAVLEVSYRRLEPAARLLLSYLSAFKLPFNREQIVMLLAPGTLAAVNEGSQVPVSQDALTTMGGENTIPLSLAQSWRAARDELVQASFIQFDGRVYTIHPQVRHFALSHLPLAERRRVHRIVAAYYYNLPQPCPEEWLTAFEHLESAAEPQDLQEAVRISVQASWALEGRGFATEVQTMLRRAAIHASRLGDRSGEGQIQCCLGSILRQLGQYAEAEACLRASLSFGQQRNEREEIAWTYYELAALFTEVGDFGQAVTYIQEALALFRESGNTNGEAWMQMLTGEVKRGRGCYHEALEQFGLALNKFQLLHDKEGHAAVLHGRGTIYQALGRYEEALKDYEEATRLFYEQGQRIEQAWVLVSQCSAYTDLGKLDLATKACNEALALFHEQGIRRGEALALSCSGMIACKKQDVVHAREYYQEASTLLSTLGDRVNLARVFAAQAALEFAEGAYLDARELYEQAAAIAGEYGARRINGLALRGLGDVAHILQQFPAAEHFYQEAASIATELDTPTDRSDVLLSQGLLCEAQQNYQEAIDLWVQALALAQRTGYLPAFDLQQKVRALVTAQHLEEFYQASCARFGLLAL